MSNGFNAQLPSIVIYHGNLLSSTWLWRSTIVDGQIICNLAVLQSYFEVSEGSSQYLVFGSAWDCRAFFGKLRVGGTAETGRLRIKYVKDFGFFVTNLFKI